ncbi:MAG: hypothetical protein M1828_001222 [Chrysothrix sp. TS-e1954]|nr:MAG: hypothetical protein M1828_001222 [Chrysothrix sp. TS-e1954]
MDCSWESSAFLGRVHDAPPDLASCIRHGSNDEFLAALSNAALDPRYTTAVFTYFQSLAVELCMRWQSRDFNASIAAFGRVLDILPHLTEAAQRQLNRDDDESDLLLDIDALNESEDTEALVDLLLGTLRLLRYNNDIFACFIRPANLQKYFHHDNLVVRYLAIRIVSMYLFASDAVEHELLSKYLAEQEIRGPYENKVIDYRFFVLWEQKRIDDDTASISQLRSERAGKAALHAENTTQRRLKTEDFSETVASIRSTLFLRSKGGSTNSKGNTPSVPTPTMNANMSKLAEAVLGYDPILVTGLPGSGKTHLIQSAAAQLGKASNMITLHLNEQSDMKLLFGVYTTGPQPGSFQWNPGVLTTAIREGRWVLIEDLDRIPTAAMSALLPLIERREVTIPNRNEVVKASNGFKILATMRSKVDHSGEERTPLSRLLGARLWHQVSLDPLQIPDIHQIIRFRYPILSKYQNKMIDVYQKTEEKLTVLAGQNPALRARPLSFRDLIKWCGRAAHSLIQAGCVTGEEAVLERVTLDDFFLDAMSCFVGHVADEGARSIVAEVAEVVARDMQLDPQRRDLLLFSRSPRFRMHKGELDGNLVVGRATLPLTGVSRPKSKNAHGHKVDLNDHTLRLMEQVGVALGQKEPTLLVGETGIGKTTIVQHLATMLRQTLTTINLSQQSEGGDLLGGFKPVNARTFMTPLKNEFDALYSARFDTSKNVAFTKTLHHCIVKGDWGRTLKLWRAAVGTINKTFDKKKRGSKRLKVSENLPSSSEEAWKSFASRLAVVERRINEQKGAFAFAFVEGKLVNAIRNGDWVLLDEINLASQDTLECVAELLDTGKNGQPSLMLSETGRTERIEAHPNFRLFAAMNPANDAGKRELPAGIRHRFTELFVHSPERDETSLKSIVTCYLEGLLPTRKDKGLVPSVTDLYLQIQKLNGERQLVDGSGQPPLYSLRSLTRSLVHASTIRSTCTIRRALYEGFCMCFCTCLNVDCGTRVKELIVSKLFDNNKAAHMELVRPLGMPDDSTRYISVPCIVKNKPGHVGNVKQDSSTSQVLLLPQGELPSQDSDNYIVTPYIWSNLENLARVARTRRHPVLIQGPTSAGKTSMVEYLAQRSGNEFVRINNHEHTDLQEYLGTYVSNEEGQIIFQEGVLVKALRKGSWVILDELNLAPTDVLEALNRLLDDNRELLIPETQEVVQPHPNFMLFATQNPSGVYGGRKPLSRAFRNRFLELHFDDIPVDELEIILATRSKLPPSWCKKIVSTYKELEKQRHLARTFEQHSSATLRDLFRWALRQDSVESIESLASNGYMLLVEKVRDPAERYAVKEVIEKEMSGKGVRISITEDSLYNAARCPEMRATSPSIEQSLVWTKSMRRLYTLVAHALRNNEPVLLVGETGCGKTTVCQMLAKVLGKHLEIFNANQHTETGDIIGAQRPIRNKSALDEQLKSELKSVLSITSEIETRSLDVNELLERYDVKLASSSDSVSLETRRRIRITRGQRKALFEWQDGSIVRAMRGGQFFLLDEISLAEDSVLERLNSVLDPQRSLLLAEKGTSESLVQAKPGFQFMATMNPGSDHGKRELSIALRNRFTEIWMPPMTEVDDVLQIVESKLSKEALRLAEPMVLFAQWFGGQYRSIEAASISIRDVLAWVVFVNCQMISGMQAVQAVIHGAAMVFIDTLGANPTGFVTNENLDLEAKRTSCLSALAKYIQAHERDVIKLYNVPLDVQISEEAFAIGSFAIGRVARNARLDEHFSLDTPTTKKNVMRVTRGLQVAKPIMLEGSPGVGKTALVAALAQVTGNSLTRINLSEQTDLMDLFGSDAPVEGAEAGAFAWRDAPFLTAMKRGEWVLLDEMNLASQSILEGLNACLDHRGEVYIPELDQTFTKHTSFRLFATQNPHQQGGGRKGLPSSFVNRFTVVFAEVFSPQDLQLICERAFPAFERLEIEQLVNFVTQLNQQVKHAGTSAFAGGPWEFNLRDIIRILQLSCSKKGLLPAGRTRDFVDIIVTQRFRSTAAHASVAQLCFDLDSHSSSGAFDQKVDQDPFLIRRVNTINMSTDSFQVGLGLLSRSGTLRSRSASHVNFNGRFHCVESVMLAVQQRMPVILTGHTGSGKSRLLASLASALGVHLETFSVNADIDATDLVGAYEQVDPSRQNVELMSQIRETVQWLLLAAHFHSKALPNSSAQFLLFQLLTMLHKPIHSVAQHVTVAAMAEQLVGIQDSSTFAEPTSLDNLVQMLANLQTNVRLSKSAMTGRFEWHDGALVRALETGTWLVLDKANLCSASVLDRLNSLLEPDGTLIINECASADGMARVIKPHPNFRIFFTVDPQYGELSRAMRNRAVEIHMPLNYDRETLHSQGAFKNSPLEAAMFRYCSLVRYMNRTDVEPEWMARLALERLSFGDMAILPSFLEQARNGLVHSSNQKLLYDAGRILLQSQSRQKHASLEAPADLCSFVSTQIGGSAHFQLSQSIYTLNNEHLVLYKPRPLPLHDAAWLASAQDIAYDVANIGSMLSAARDAAGQSQSLNRLQRSMESGRNRSFQRDRTSWTAVFLKDLHESLNQCIALLSQSPKPDAESDQVIDAFSFWGPIMKLVGLWKRLYDILTDNQYSKMAFNTCLTILWKSVSEIAQSDSIIAAPMSSVGQGLATKYDIGDYRKGLSMERLWLAFRPPNLVMKDPPLADVQDETPFFHSLQQMITARLEVLSELDAAASQGFSDGFSKDSESVGVNEESPRGWRTPTEALHALSISMSRWNSNSSQCPYIFRNLANDVLKRLSSLDSVPLRQLEKLQQDTSIIGREVAKGASVLCINPAMSITRLLSSITGKVLELFEPNSTLVEAYVSDPTQLVSILRQGLQSFAVHEGAFENRQVGHLRTAGASAIAVALACLQLYVPNQIYDPAMRAVITKSLYDESIQTLDAKIQALQQLEKISTGCATNLRILLAQAQKKESAAYDPPSPKVVRSSELSFVELQSTFDIIRETFPLSDNDVQQRMKTGFLPNIAKVITRLQEHDPNTGDVWRPAVGFLNVLRVGILLSEPSSEQNDALQSTMALSDSTPMMISKARAWPGEEFSTSMEDEERSVASLEHRLSLLSLAAQIDKSIIMQQTPQQQLLTSFEYLHYQWRGIMEIDRTEELASSTLYSYQEAKQTQESPEDEEMASKFPDYDGNIQQSHSQTGQHAHNAQNARALALKAATLHLRIFEDGASPIDQLQPLIDHTATRIGRLAIGTTSEVEQSSTRTLLPAGFLLMRKAKDSLNDLRETAVSYNVYTDSNIKEAKKLIAVTQDTLSWFNELVKIWPEHATLHHVIDTCDEVLNFRHVEPVMKFLTKVEKLHAYIAEWQCVTSRQYSASLLQARLVSLITGWRRLELSTWAQLLDQEMEKCADDARSWWFLAYENIISIPSSAGNTDDTLKLVETLDMFLRASPLGQFSHRLRLMSSLLKQLQCAAESRPTLLLTCRAIGNLIQHLQRHTINVNTAIAAQRQALEKEIRNVIELASWREQNVIALKQNAKASHQKLFRIIKKFRDALARPVEGILSEEPLALQDESSECIPTIATNPRDQALHDYTDGSAVMRDLPNMSESSLHIGRAGTTPSEQSAIESNAADLLNESLEDLQNHIQELQKQTPSTLTKDNASFVKNLTAQKRRLLASTLKDLLQMGFKADQNMAVLAKQDSTCKVLVKLPDLGSQHFLLMSEARVLLHRSLKSMVQVRAAKAGHHDDLHHSDIERSVGYLESILATVIHQQTTLAEVSAQCRHLYNSCGLIRTLWSGVSSTVRPIARATSEYQDALFCVLKWLPTIIEMGMRMLDAQADLGGMDFSVIQGRMKDWHSAFVALTARVVDLPRVPDALMHGDCRFLLQETRSQLVNFHRDILQWSSEVPVIEPTLEQVLLWVYIPQQPEDSFSNEYNPLEIEDWLEELHRVSDIMKFAARRSIEDHAKMAAPNITESKWLLHECQARERLLQELNAYEVHQKLERLLAQLPQVVGPNDSALANACASFAAILPALTRYREIYRQVGEELARLHLGISKLLHRLSNSFCQIASQGFCKPSEKSDESGQASDKLESGTGLGAGEGAEDISKDVGDDEDMSELAQDADNKNENGELDNNDDAVDIDEQLVGGHGNEMGEEMEDEEKQDGDEEAGKQETAEVEGDEVSGGEGQEGDSEMDEGVGEVNDLEDDAKDEKRLNQKGDKSKKQKEAKAKSQDIEKDEDGANASVRDGKVDDSEAQADGDHDDSSASEDGATDREGAEGLPQDAEAMDPHLEQTEGLDLPEDLKLDGDKKDDRDSDADADDDMLDDVEQEEQNAREAMESDTGGEEAQDSGVDVEEENRLEGVQEDEDQKPQDGEDDARHDIEADHEGSGTDEDQEATGGPGRSTARAKSVNTVNDDAHAANESDDMDDQTDKPSGARARRGRQTDSMRNARDAEGHDPTGQDEAMSQTLGKQSVRQAGTASEKWHRNQRQIHEASARDEGQQGQQDVDMTDAEFEHLQDGEEKADTQALGASVRDQAMAIDDSMALPSDGPGQDQHQSHDFTSDIKDEDDVQEMDAEMRDADSMLPTEQDITRIGDRTDEQGMVIDSKAQTVPAEEEIQSSDNEPQKTMTIRDTRSSPSPTTIESPYQIWQRLESTTRSYAEYLSTQLRQILEPTIASQMRGDFRTGKRLNIKRIIPYIASNYKRDKIWMRRSIPNKRAYQVMLAIDDSKSMRENGSIELAFAALALVAQGLNKAEAGEIGVLAFGERVEVAHELGMPFLGEAGPHVIENFTFAQNKTNMKKLIEDSLSQLSEARLKSSSSRDTTLWQIEFVLSDGIFDDHEGVARLLRKAQEERVLFVFIIVDAPRSSDKSEKGKARGAQYTSIADQKCVEFVQGPIQEDGQPGEMTPRIVRYLDTFPFRYYLIVKDVNELPSVLASALRQWFAEVADM